MTAEAHASHRQNRVTPCGDIESSAAKGMFLGNRGDLLRKDGRLGRAFKQRFWITCTLDEVFGTKVTFDRPGSYTPLFFLDEATAFAAGHRPCAMCRRADYNRFRSAWQNAGLHPAGGFLPVKMIDDQLHAARLTSTGEKLVYPAMLGDLPEGVIFTDPATSGGPQLKWNGKVWCWNHFGYGNPADADAGREVNVLTPRPVVDVFRAGYAPLVHPSASSS